MDLSNWYVNCCNFLCSLPIRLYLSIYYFEMNIKWYYRNDVIYITNTWFIVVFISFYSISSSFFFYSPNLRKHIERIRCIHVCHFYNFENAINYFIFITFIRTFILLLHRNRNSKCTMCFDTIHSLIENQVNEMTRLNSIGHYDWVWF